MFQAVRSARKSWPKKEEEEFTGKVLAKKKEEEFKGNRSPLLCKWIFVRLASFCYDKIHVSGIVKSRVKLWRSLKRSLKAREEGSLHEARHVDANNSRKTAVSNKRGISVSVRLRVQREWGACLATVSCGTAESWSGWAGPPWLAQSRGETTWQERGRKRSLKRKEERLLWSERLLKWAGCM